MVPSGVQKHTCQLCATARGCTLMTQQKIFTRLSSATWRAARCQGPKPSFTKLSSRYPVTPGKQSSTIVRPVSAALAIRRSGQSSLFIGPIRMLTGSSSYITEARSASATVVTWPGSFAGT